jgi:hypothetical protein
MGALSGTLRGPLGDSLSCRRQRAAARCPASKSVALTPIPGYPSPGTIANRSLVPPLQG